MKNLLSRSKRPSLDERLESLRTAVEIGRDRLDSTTIDPARSVLERASERMALGAELTVVALAGATGSGKSSLFNALSGSDLSQVGVRRPTTGTAHAAVWGENSSEPLLDWLNVPRRHRASDAELDGLVLLDLPDHDSTEVAHRFEVDRLAQLVDMFVWVLDPQKYADAALHEGYLRPLATHAAVTLVVLNQIDRLGEADRRRCMVDVARLVERDGLRGVKVIPVSARTGEGVAELRAAVAERVREQRAAAERLSADVDAVSSTLLRHCAGAAGGISDSVRQRLVDALAVAAGVEVVTRAVAKAHRRDAALATGWPFTRWVRRLRPDPLARLHLRRDSGGGVTSLPASTPLQRAQVESSTRAVAAEAAGDLPQSWIELVRRRIGSETGALLDDLDRAVGQVDLGDDKRPLWWTLVGGLQTLLAAAAAVGFLWLTVLFALEWFQIPRPPTPEAREIPWPTLLLFGGLLAGFLLSALAGLVARLGAAVRKRRAQKHLKRAVAAVADERVLAPLQQELDNYIAFCDAVRRMKPR